MFTNSSTTPTVPSYRGLDLISLVFHLMSLTFLSFPDFPLMLPFLYGFLFVYKYFTSSRIHSASTEPCTDTTLFPPLSLCESAGNQAPVWALMHLTSSSIPFLSPYIGGRSSPTLNSPRFHVTESTPSVEWAAEGNARDGSMASVGSAVR